MIAPRMRTELNCRTTVSLNDITTAVKALTSGLNQVEQELALVKKERRPLEGDRFIEAMEVSRSTVSRSSLELTCLPHRPSYGTARAPSKPSSKIVSSWTTTFALCSPTTARIRKRPRLRPCLLR